MALPLMQTPVYELVIPSTQKAVKYRPFLVKEEKALLLAQQSEDSKVMLETLKKVISNCVSGVDAEKLALFDLEYIFLQLRARSVGELSELTYACLECNDPKAKVNIKLDISTINVEFNDKHTATIDLFDSVGVKMKYPSLDILVKLGNINDEDIDSALKVIAQCIEFLYDGDKIYPSSEQSEEELIEFLEKLTRYQLEKIKNFFTTMPRLRKKVEFDCPVCKFHHQYTIEGIENFF